MRRDTWGFGGARGGDAQGGGGGGAVAQEAGMGRAVRGARAWERSAGAGLWRKGPEWGAQCGARGRGRALRAGAHGAEARRHQSQTKAAP